MSKGITNDGRTQVLRCEPAEMASGAGLETAPDFGDILGEVLREGAQRMLIQVLNEEVEAWLSDRRGITDSAGRRQVVRNGYHQEREVQTGIGPIPIRVPRARDLRTTDKEVFTSKLLPPYLRKAKSLESLIPWLYLKGVSSGDFQEALGALLGPDAAGLSATTVTRLKKVWEDEFQEWEGRSLEGKEYVYIWVDGIYFNIRLEEDRQCILIVMGVTSDGKKELIAIQDGYRESEHSWKSLLLDLKNRGLTTGPKLAIGDGALGFWKALRQVYPETREQRCTVHKTVNVLDKMPKSLQSEAKRKLQEIWSAPTRSAAEKAFDLFIETYGAKYEKATECLAKDRDVLLTYYDFPAEHWRHIRTTNPIESMFATVRLRTKRTKGCGSRLACLAMVFKLSRSAQRRWRLLNGVEHLTSVQNGVTFTDGLETRKHAA